MDKKAIGRRIREARESALLSGDRLGELLDPPITRQAVSLWEVGTNYPDLKRVEQLCSVLNISPEWLLFGETKPLELSQEEIDLINYFRAMSANSRASILLASRALSSEQSNGRNGVKSESKN